MRIELGTIIGKDDYLFLADGSHSPLAFMTGKKEVGRDSIRHFQRNLIARERFCRKNGAAYVHFVAADKHVALRDHLPAIDRFVSLADQYAGQIAPTFLHAPEAFAGAGTFWRTDTHWAPEGRVVAAELLARAFGFPEARIAATCTALRAAIVRDGDYAGDLGRRFDPPRSEPRMVFRPDWKQRRFENGIGANDGLIMAQYSEHPDAIGRLLIFGDSFMQETLPVLGAFFKEILYCRSRYFHPDIALQAHADFVLTQNVARYLSAVESDLNAPPFILLPQIMAREVKYDQERAAAIGALMSRRDGFYRNFVAITLPDYVPLPVEREAVATLAGLSPA